MLVFIFIISACKSNSANKVGIVKKSYLSPQATSKPNVIIVLADDLGYGDLGCYGQQKIKTPNIDQLASQGIRFTNFYSGSTVCAPSRNTLLTGQHTGNCTVRGNGVNDQRIPLSESDTTIAMLMKNIGYNTAAIGKWGLGEQNTNATPNKKGFDYWFGFLNQKKAHYYFPDTVWENNERYVIPENLDKKQNTNIHNLFTQKAKDFIIKNKKDPFFLYLAYTAPHAELIARESSMKKYMDVFPEKTFEGSSSYPPNPNPRATYAAMIDQLDEDVGEIQLLLDSLGLNENTLIIFTSDNGPEALGKHGCDPDFFNSTANLRGVKRSLYEGGIKVPMIVKWNHVISQQQISNKPGALWDLLPSICDVTGIKPPKNINGISLLPEIVGNDKNTLPNRQLYWEFHRSGFESVLACRDGKWKAIYYFAQDIVELYDLKNDPYETTDLSSDYFEVASRLKEFMLTERKESEYWKLSKEKIIN